MSRTAKPIKRPNVGIVQEAIRIGNLRHPEIRRFGRYLEEMLNTDKTYEAIAMDLGFSTASSITRLRDSAGLRERVHREVYSIVEGGAAE